MIEAAHALGGLEALAPDAPWTVHTEVFDGPLDLLLYLVERDGIDLKKLEVRRIADSYLGYLDRMRELNLSIAGDYLLMAATLVHLKSLELLPRPPVLVADEPEDPREELARRLREYQRHRAAADALEARPWVGRDTFVREPLEVDPADRPLVAGVDAFGLLDLYWEVLRRASAPEARVGFELPSGPDFPSCCRRVLGVLGGRGGRAELGTLLRALELRAERVVTFVGVLEMCRLGWLGIVQLEHLGPVHVEQLVDDEAIDLGLLTGFVEEEAP